VGLLREINKSVQPPSCCWCRTNLGEMMLISDYGPCRLECNTPVSDKICKHSKVVRHLMRTWKEPLDSSYQDDTQRFQLNYASRLQKFPRRPKTICDVMGVKREEGCGSRNVVSWDNAGNVRHIFIFIIRSYTFKKKKKKCKGAMWSCVVNNKRFRLYSTLCGWQMLWQQCATHPPHSY